MKVMFIILLASILAFPVSGSAQTVSKIVKMKGDGKKGYLGIGLQDVDQKLKKKKNLSVDQGVYIQNVVEDSPADKAGLKRGDVIVKFGDESVDNAEDLTDIVRDTKPKTVVKVEFYRKTEKKSVDITVGKVKTPTVLGENFFDLNSDDASMLKLYAHPSIPSVSKKLNITVFTQSGIEGMVVQTLTKQLGEYFGAPDGDGALVSEVKKESNAAKAGFKAGDVIVRVDGNRIEDVSDFEEEISDRDDKNIPVEIIRDKKTMKLTLTIEEEDDEDEDEDMSGEVLGMPHFSLPSLDALHSKLACLKDKLENLKFHLKAKKISPHSCLKES